MSDFESSRLEHQTNLSFPREKTRSLLINVFRTRRSNAGLTSSEVILSFSSTSKSFSVFFFQLVFHGWQTIQYLRIQSR